MKNNWLTLKGDTFLWIKKEKGILYNTTNFQVLRFDNTMEIEQICKKLLIPNNLYSVNISDSILKDFGVRKWIDSIVCNKMGEFMPNENAENRPLSLIPILKIQDDIQRYKWERKREIHGSILNNLHEVTFYINGSENGDKYYYKQTIYPTKTTKHLAYLDVVEFCRNIKNPFLSNVNLVGSLNLYDYHEKMICMISELGIHLTMYVTIDDFEQNNQLYHDLIKLYNITIKLLIKHIDKIDLSIFNNIEKLFCVFFITSEKDYENVYEIINKYHVVNFQIIPLFDNNIDFFTSTLFLNETDFDEMQLSKRDIFIRQCLNINNFGKFSILTNGKVYSNVNHPTIGTLKELPVDLVFKEFTEGKSWFNTRKGRPCNRCVYQWMCPSPSNYEISIKRNNLCNIVE